MKMVDKIPVRYRLALGHATWLVLLFVALGFGIFRVVEVNFNDSVDKTLVTSAKSIRDARFGQTNFSYFFHKFFADPPGADQMFGRRFIRTYARMLNVSGQVSHRTRNLDVNLPVTPKSLKRAEAGLETYETFRFQNMVPIRVLTMPIVINKKFTGDIIQVGTSLEATHQALLGVSMVLWVSLPLGLLLSLCFGYFLTKKALQPVQTMTATARGLSIHDLGVRIPLPRAKDELRELAATFNSMMDRLEDSVKRLRRFTGDVSHELRTPLAVLRAEADLALRRERPVEQYKEAIERISKESLHMSSIIEDLLLLARAESKSVAMSWQAYPSRKFVEKIVHDTEPIYLQRSVELKTNIEAGIDCIECSEGYLGLALRNIVANAAKHSSCGDVVELNLYKARSPGGTEGISFEIKDQGEGIPEADLPNIFEPFYRSDTARNRGAGGAGIGLSLAMALIKLHSGSIDVTSTVGRGATFKVFIPQMDVCGKEAKNKSVAIKESSNLVKPSLGHDLENLPTS